ncbi:hypothetical protein WNY58_14120 [Neptuniibacter pectenicola]|uniref:Carboxypeptidase regulatory-like domain-containing protein n=1 Tax=Neptuniibacter pectenicola TaxID=1806669 RepID=A0ABU9TWJ1_9GAMM
MKYTGNIVLTLTFLFVLAACVPVISKMYNGPEVSGVVLRLSNLTPIDGAIISYDGVNPSATATQSSITNAQGHFILTPTKELNVEIRMPAYTPQSVPIYTQHSTYGHSTDIAVSKWKGREYETYDIGTIILDEEPKVYAPPLTEDGVDLKVLEKAIEPQGLFSLCNLDDAGGAINKLHIVRKLAHKIVHAKQDPAQEKLAAAYIQEMKKSTRYTWAYFANDCSQIISSIELEHIKRRVFAELDSL